MIKACIFDLDGVIVDTAKYHFLAWRRLANELGFDFSKKDNEKLKGVSREESLNLILQWGGVEKTTTEKTELTELKNEWYLEYIHEMTPAEILDGVLPFLKRLKIMGVGTALGSASKNARTIIRQVGVAPFFDAIIDGTNTTRTKPDPQVFELAAEALGVPPQQAIVFEDAEKGIQAALNGGFHAVGIGETDVLKAAHLVIPDFKNTTFEDIVKAVLTE